MNKQQLAAKIWESANQMCSKIEDFSEVELRALTEEDTETVEHIKGNIGHFIV